MGNTTITKIARLSDKLSRSKLNELEQQTQTKFIFKGVCGEIDFYANCSDVFKIKYKRSGTQYLIKGLEVSENEFYKTYNHIWCILKNNNNIEFSQITEWDSQSDLEAPYKYNMIPCAIKTFVIDVYTFKDGKVIYHDIKMNKHEATINSSFYHEIDSAQATEKYGAIVSTTPVNHTYKIDGHCVDRDTFNEVINLFKGVNSTADFDMSFDNLTHIDKPIKIAFEGESMTEKELSKKLRERLADKDFQTIAGRQSLFNIVESIIDDNLEEWKVADPMIPQSVIEESLNKLWGKRAECCIYDDYMYIGNSAYKQLKKMLNSIEKENEDMPKIVNYKYNEETGTTTLFWADKTQTTVTADNLAEASQFEGFCAACAKKLFGNKSTYLNQFDKWTVKIPERERLAAEKKAAEDKEREEAKARKAAKKAERRAKREVELLAKEFADNYKHESTWEKAKKLAMKKYGVPADYFDDGCDCHCGCKEFDVIDEDENNISD